MLVLETKLNRLKALRVKTITNILESVNVKDAILAVKKSSEKLCSLVEEEQDPIALTKINEQIRKNSEFFLTIAGACVPFNALEEQLEKERNSGFNSFLEKVKEIEEIDFQDIPTENKTEL